MANDKPETNRYNDEPSQFKLNSYGYIPNLQKVAIASMLSVVSSRLKPHSPVNRLNLMVVSENMNDAYLSVRNLLNLLDRTDIYFVLPSTALAKFIDMHMFPSELDGKILQIHNPFTESMNYADNLMKNGEDGYTVTSTKEKFVIRGQPTFIFTGNTDLLDMIPQETLDKTFKLYVTPLDKITKLAIMLKEPKVEDSLVFYAWVLQLPQTVDIDESIERHIKEFMSLLPERPRVVTDYINYTFRNLLRVFAIVRNKTKVDDDVFDETMQFFKADIAYNLLGMSEAEALVLKVIDGEVDSDTIVNKSGISYRYAYPILNHLRKLGMIEYVSRKHKEDIWRLTEYGDKVKRSLLGLNQV
jgi:predicted transcriptional regulator